MKKHRWAVTQIDFEWSEDDTFETKKEAEQYLKDCFEPEHQARVIKVAVADSPNQGGLSE